MQYNQKTHKLTYTHLLRHADENSTQGLALSEFVDNSISSYLDMSPDRNEIANIGGCIISITIDEQDPKNIKIWIKDNAEGMDYSTLDDSAHEYHNSFEKNSNQINQYGVGMKFAIFWFGKNGKIWTKKQNEAEYFLDYEVDKHNENDEVVTPIIKSTDNKIDGHGTIILIENVRDENTRNRRLLTVDGDPRKTFDDVLNTLRFRFREYFKQGLFIKFYKITKDSKKAEFIEEINATNIKETMIFETKSFTLKRICDIENIADSSAEQRADLELKKAHFNQLKVQPEISGVKDYENLLWNIENGDPLKFKEKIIFNGASLDVDFCFLAKANKKFCGVGIKHCNRFIYHLPNRNYGKNALGAMPFTDNDRYRDGIHKWMYAEIDLTDTKKYGIKPDKNKSQLIWSEDQLEAWNTAFTKIIDKYTNFIRLVLQVLTNTSKIDKKKRFIQGLDSGNLSENFSFEKNGDITYDVTGDDDFSKQYNIGEAKILIKENKNLENILFSWKEIGKNSYELEYDSEHEILNRQFLDFNFLKLVGLLSLISTGKFKTDDTVLDIINNITKGDDLE